MSCSTGSTLGRKILKTQESGADRVRLTNKPPKPDDKFAEARAKVGLASKISQEFEGKPTSIADRSLSVGQSGGARGKETDAMMAQTWDRLQVVAAKPKPAAYEGVLKTVVDGEVTVESSLSEAARTILRAYPEAKSLSASDVEALSEADFHALERNMNKGISFENALNSRKARL